jgi:hypothetical protein
MSNVRTLLELRDQLQKLLIETAKERKKRPEFVKDAKGWNVPAWVLHECHVMCEAVNRARSERGWAPVTEADIAKVETFASGHVDYASKYALYCAEIASQEKPHVTP